MSESKFWQFVSGKKHSLYEWVGKRPHDWEWVGAFTLLRQELPEAIEWESWGESPRCLMLEFLCALAGGSFDENSPKPMQFNPADIMLHFSEEDFEAILFQKPPRGAITFVWTTYDEDGFQIPRSEHRLATYLRQEFYQRGEGENGYIDNLTGATLGFIRGKKLELYVFPNAWSGIVEHVHQELKKMTATEKAKKQLPYELKAFVDLLGWSTVSAELEKLRPYEEIRKQKRDACLRGDHVWGEISGELIDPIQNCVNCGKPSRINMTDREWFDRKN